MPTVLEARSPSLSSGLEGWKPFWRVSTRNSEIEACAGPVSLFAATTAKSATPPFVMYILVPFSTQSPPVFRAVVRRPETSEPASGSVTARQPMREPEMAGRRNSSCCSAVPRCRMIGVAMWAWTRYEVTKPPLRQRLISSTTGTASSRPPPEPPSRCG